MSNLLERISKILDCTIDNVRQRLTNKCDRDRVLNEIRGKALKTNYLDRNGQKQKIYCDGISSLGSHQIMAYGNLKQPFNICVSAYFHARHKIMLKHPFHPCIQFKNCYYPLELLDLVEDFDESDSDSPIIMKNLRKKASSSSESVQSLDSFSTNSTFKERQSTEAPDELRRGILWLYVNDKKMWEKHTITLFSSK